MIKTVIFDIGNVLVTFSWQEHFASFGYDSTTLERLAKATVFNQDWKHFDLGLMSDDAVIDLLVENDPGIEKEIRQSLSNMNGILTRRDYTIPWIQELKGQGYQVLFLSNFFEKVKNECAHAMDFLSYMDGGVFSFKAHLLKPDSAIYKHLLAKYNLKPSECVFLDDTLGNIEAARALGFYGIHFKDLIQAKEELTALGVQ